MLINIIIQDLLNYFFHTINGEKMKKLFLVMAFIISNNISTAEQKLFTERAIKQIIAREAQNWKENYFSKLDEQSQSLLKDCLGNQLDAFKTKNLILQIKKIIQETTNKKEQESFLKQIKTLEGKFKDLDQAGKEVCKASIIGKDVIETIDRIFEIAKNKFPYSLMKRVLNLTKISQDEYWVIVFSEFHKTI